MIHDDYLERCGKGHDIAEHMPRLFSAAAVGDATVIELGVRRGNSTAAFLAAVEAHGGHVHSVDIATPRTPAEWLSSGLWTLRVGNDLDLADQMPDDVDVLFIDTDHTYAQTLAELRTYAAKVKPGGVILLHDTELEHPEAATAVDPAFPVAEAIKTWAAETGNDVEWVPGCYGLGVIRTKEATT
jgi:predicted O-methyltransferase YrrM